MNRTLLDKDDRQRNDSLSVPYRLETAADITRAMEHDVLGLGTKTYQRLLDVQKNVLIIKKPLALQTARPVARDFFVLRERKVNDLYESYRKAEGLNRISNYDLIRDHIIGIEELINPEFLTTRIEAVHGRPVNEGLRGRAHTLKRYRQVREIIGREMRSMMHCKNTRSITMQELKRIIIALTLQDNRNRDVMQALKIAKGMGDDILWSNALAELYFARLPRSVKSLFVDDPKITVTLRKQLLSRIARLSAPVNLKIALFHMAPRTNTRNKEDFITMTKKMCSLIEKAGIIGDEAKISIMSFIHNLIGELRVMESMYQKLFLPSKGLKNLFRLYVPNNRMVRCSITHTERIIQEHCSTQALSMYPCKDYLDLEKYRWSGDCTQYALGVIHLATSHFFNIRLFRNDREYCGNIYMLQFECDSKYYLLVDRIQTSEFSTKYTMFFKVLRDVFLEMFQDFPFHEILVPNDSVSNNKSLNQIFHSAKSEFPKKRMCFTLSDGDSFRFESLRGDTFRVLCEKKC